MNSGIEDTFNFARFLPGQTQGHYESYFQRANHPERPLAFWIRYTVFIPHKQPENAIGELWAVYFDGESGHHTALKQEMPISLCQFARDRFSVSAGNSVLDAAHLTGEIKNAQGRISWNLEYDSPEPPLFLFPKSMYSGGFPKAKVLVGSPLARFSGNLQVNGQDIEIKDWRGSQNHNWGSKHTDHYAWGQVSGFDNAPDSFLEIATARLKVGPIWIPAITPVVMRHRGREFRLNQILRAFGRASFGYFHWEFQARSGQISLQGRITARADDFVCLRYYNPPGGSKFCLNSKIARCELKVQMEGAAAETLVSRSGAAFEILTDKDDHGMKPAC